MKTSSCVGLLFLATFLSANQATQRSEQAAPSSQAEIPVRRLYQQLMSHPIDGIPAPGRMKLFSPYLSKSLLHRVAQTRACANDWFRLHPQNDVKAPFAWEAFGLFSGGNERSGPRSFQIEKMESENDGPFRAYIRLTEGNPPERPWTWRVEDIVTREGGRYVIDDVIFLKDKDVDTESRLSEILTEGCDGSHWVGFKKGLT